MRLRGIAACLAVAALGVAGVTFSGAAFTAASANNGNSFTASNAFNLSATMTDPGANLHATVTLQATASDGGDGSTITLVTIQKSPAGAGTWTTACTDSTSPYSCSWDSTTVTDGLYDFRALVQNDAGGSATSAAVTNRRVDNTAPTAGITDPGTPLKGTVTVSATGTDTGGSGVANVKVQRSPAGAGTWTDICTDASSPYSCSWDTTGVTDGLYDLRSVSTDNAGNSTNSSTVANRRVDNTAPTATMTNPGSPITGNKSFDGTSTDTGGSGVASLKFQISPVGAGSWSDMCSDTTSPYSCSYDTSGVADGQYDFRSVATDNAGNTANSTVYSGAIVDNTAPTVTMTDPGQYLRGTITLDATAGDGAGSGVANVKIQRSPAGAGTWTDICTDNSSPYQCASVNTATWGGDGLYDLRAVATDNVAKTTNSTVVTNRRVDNTAPTAGMTDPGAHLAGTTVALSATGTDGGSGVANVKIQRSPAGAGTWTDVCTDSSSPYGCTFDTTAVSDGLYDLRAITTDNAGNTDDLLHGREPPRRQHGADGVADRPRLAAPPDRDAQRDRHGQAAPASSTSPSSARRPAPRPGRRSAPTPRARTPARGTRRASPTAATTFAPSRPTTPATPPTRRRSRTASWTTRPRRRRHPDRRHRDDGRAAAAGRHARLHLQRADRARHDRRRVERHRHPERHGDDGHRQPPVHHRRHAHQWLRHARRRELHPERQDRRLLQLDDRPERNHRHAHPGHPDKPQFTQTGTAGQTSWPVAAALTDLAGNAITTVTCLETSPPVDAEF